MLVTPTNNLVIRPNPNRVYLAVVPSLPTTGTPNMSTQSSLAAGSVYGFLMNGAPQFELSFHVHGPLVGAAWYATGLAGNAHLTVFEVCVGPLTPMQ